jgi:predicted DNA-binding protein (UPF0251 family)
MTTQHGRSWAGAWAPLKPCKGRHPLSAEAVRDLAAMGWTAGGIAAVLSCTHEEVVALVPSLVGSDEAPEVALNPRERNIEILRLVAEGLKYEVIAETLACSMSTVAGVVWRARQVNTALKLDMPERMLKRPAL